jgi:putative membrane protein
MSEHQDDNAGRNRRAHKRDEKLSRRTSLAFDRSVAASDRTLMASLRTALSMISFGFAIFEGSNFLAQAEEWSAAGPRRLGWALVLGGTLLLIVSLSEHRRYVRKLTHKTGHEMPISGALVSTVLFLGLALLVIINWLFGLGVF